MTTPTVSKVQPPIPATPQMMVKLRRLEISETVGIGVMMRKMN
jgi:hypothetical protein